MNIPEDVDGDGVVTGSDMLQVQRNIGKIGTPDWWEDATIGHDVHPFTSNNGYRCSIFAAEDAVLEPGRYEVFCRGEFLVLKTDATPEDWDSFIQFFPHPPQNLIGELAVPRWREAANEVIDPHQQYDLVTVAHYGEFNLSIPAVAPIVLWAKTTATQSWTNVKMRKETGRMTIDVDSNGYKKTTRVNLVTAGRFYVREETQDFPEVVHGAGLSMQDVHNRTFTGLDVNDLYDESRGDCLSLNACSDLTFSDCSFTDFYDEALDGNDCWGTMTFNNCIFGPGPRVYKEPNPPGGADDYAGNHDYTMLIQAARSKCHWVFNDCTLVGQDRMPRISPGNLVTINNCDISFAYSCINIRGYNVRVNILGNTTFTNIASHADDLVRYPARKPLNFFESSGGLNDYERPCVYVERTWNWTNTTDKLGEEEMVYIWSGTEADPTLLFSDTIFTLNDMDDESA